MASKAIEISTIVVSPKQYQVSIEGTGAVIFDKMPDLSIVDNDKKKLDPIEREKLKWRKKLYYDGNDMIYIPGENLHESLKEGAKYWNQTIPGEGKKTYTNLIAAAVVVESLELGIHKDDKNIIAFGKMCNMNPSKGKKSGSKAYVIRPMIPPTWGGTFRMFSFDARLTKDVLKTILTFAGTFSAVGAWRPVYGRYKLVSIDEIS